MNTNDCSFFDCSDAGDSLNDCRIIFLGEIYKIEEAGSPAEVSAGSESPLKSMLRSFFSFFKI